MKPWVKYSLVRIGVFALAFGAMLAVGVIWWLAAILAAVISLCIAYIFFRAMRDAMTADLAKRRANPAEADADADAEDTAEGAEDSAAGTVADAVRHTVRDRRSDSSNSA